MLWLQCMEVWSTKAKINLKIASVDNVLVWTQTMISVLHCFKEMEMESRSLTLRVPLNPMRRRDLRNYCSEPQEVKPLLISRIYLLLSNASWAKSTSRSLFSLSSSRMVVRFVRKLCESATHLWDSVSICLLSLKCSKRWKKLKEIS